MLEISTINEINVFCRDYHSIAASELAEVIKEMLRQVSIHSFFQV